MPTSTNTDWVLSASQLILAAAQELGAIEMGDSLEAGEEEACLQRLNAMLAKWSVDSNIWREATATITITANTGAATLPTAVRDIRSVRHVVNSSYKRPLQAWNRDEFMRLPNRAQTGQPVAFYYSQQIDGDQLYIWPVATTNQDFELDYNRGFYQVESTDQTLDLPREWYEAALYGLAARCANLFGTTRIDPATVQRVDAQAKFELDRMLDSDRPDYYRFEWDSPVEAYP